jgi:hypothetical protein
MSKFTKGGRNLSKSDALIESRSLRESVIDRTDVLDKVKKLVMLPDDLHISVEMAASYFEVSKSTIEAVIHDHRDEVESDGLKVLRGEELTCFKQVANISKRARAFTIIPRRAVLRIGMLLRDSKVAKTVRDYLLNVEEVARKETPQVIDKAAEFEMKRLRAEAMLKNAKVREAKLIMQMTEKFKDKLSSESIEALIGTATAIITDSPVLPAPKIEKTYTAEEIARELGTTSNMIGRMANKLGLKTAKYGYNILGKSKYSEKQVPQFIYNELGRQELIKAYKEKEKTVSS